LKVDGATFLPTDADKLANLSQRPLSAPSLVAIAAQCNFTGMKQNLQELDIRFRASDNVASGPRWFTLLDAASWVSSSPLDLSVIQPDFIALSFYKIFGFPTGLGALLVRQDSLQTLNKSYFGGGTVAASLSSERFHQLRPDFRRFEDGTSDFLGIISLKFGFSFVESLGGMRSIQQHTHTLWRYCLEKMRSLRHASSNAQLVKIYGIPNEEPLSSQRFGPIISFNLVREDGKTWIGYAEVEKFASLEKIQLRTGCFCNPGACETYLQLDAEDVKRNLAAGHVCWDDKDVINGKPTGAIRLSISYFATHNDIDVRSLSRIFFQG
jgi:molybdenum cofactor sulfurtransferase